MNQSEASQRRYFSHGGDRAVAGAADLGQDERFTGQRRIDDGNGDARKELYHYGARFYLPGLGLFTQPDTIVPDYKNPQSLNRYRYALNNPLRHTDPTGYDPLDAEWEAAFKAAHGGNAPTDQDKLDRLMSYLSGSSWSDADWQQYTAAKQGGLVNPEALLAGTSGSVGERIRLASALVMLATSSPTGSKIYSFLSSHGTNVQFGGGLGQQAGASVGEGIIFGYPTNTIFLDPDLASEGAEIVAANIAHEAYHIEAQMVAAGHAVIIRSPFSKTEEMHAFAQEARAWEGLRVTYRGSNAWWYDTILSQYRAGNLKDFVGSQAIYMQWFYQISQ